MALLHISQNLSYFRRLLIALYDQFINDISAAQRLCPAALTASLDYSDQDETSELVAPHQITYPAIENIANKLLRQSLFLINYKQWEKFKEILEGIRAEPAKYADSQIRICFNRVFLSGHQIKEQLTNDKNEIDFLSKQRDRLQTAMQSTLEQFLANKHSSGILIDYGTGYSYVSSMWLWLLGKSHQGFLAAVMHSDNCRVESMLEVYSALPRNDEEDITGIFIDLIFFHTKDIQKINSDNTDAYLLRTLIEFRHVISHLLALRLIQDLELNDRSLSDIDDKISASEQQCKAAYDEIKKLLKNISKIKEVYTKRNPPSELEERKNFEANKLILLQIEKSLYKIHLITNIFLGYLEKVRSENPLESLRNEAITPVLESHDLYDSFFIQKLSEYNGDSLKALLAIIKKESDFFPIDYFNDSDLNRDVIHWWTHCIDAIIKTAEKQPGVIGIISGELLNRHGLFSHPKPSDKICIAGPSVPRHQ